MRGKKRRGEKSNYQVNGIYNDALLKILDVRIVCFKFLRGRENYKIAHLLCNFIKSN